MASVGSAVHAALGMARGRPPVFGFRPLGRRVYDRPTTYDPAVSYILRSRIRPRPATTGVVDDDDQEPRELVAEADTYEAAYAQLHEQLPQGWVLLGVDRYLEDQKPE